jgi:hypothetical protein
MVMVLVPDPSTGKLVDTKVLYKQTSGSILGVTEESAALGFRSRGINPESEAFRVLQSEGLPIYQAQLTSLAVVSQKGQVSTQRVIPEVSQENQTVDAGASLMPLLFLAAGALLLSGRRKKW